MIFSAQVQIEHLCRVLGQLKFARVKQVTLATTLRPSGDILATTWRPLWLPHRNIGMSCQVTRPLSFARDTLNKKIGCRKSVPRVSQGCLKGVARVSQECRKGNRFAPIGEHLSYPPFRDIGPRTHLLGVARGNLTTWSGSLI